MSSSLHKLWIATLIIASYTCPSWGESPKIQEKNSNQNWRGIVTHVSDGDTLWVQPTSGGAAVNIRIDAIDAPEICQAWGPEAKAALSARVLHQTVHVNGKRRDGFGRLLARVRVHDSASPTDVGQTMVAGGHAWAHQYKNYKSVYGADQQQAQAARRGLFAQAKAQHPRDFRQRHGPCEHKSGKVK